MTLCNIIAPLFYDIDKFVCVCFLLTVQTAIQLVSQAKKPVILLGSQATLPPTPVDQLRKSLEVCRM